MKILYSNLVLTIALTALAANVTYAQLKVNGTVSGKVVNAKTKLPVEYGVVTVIDLRDSSVADNGMTGKSGDFKISGLAAGKYQLQVSFMGYQRLKVPFEISQQAAVVNLGNLSIVESGISLSEVKVTGEKPPVVLKPDTVEFNAGSFKTRPNAMTEELLKKLPGVEVDNDGNIKAHGETVSKVLVDGKEFFGSDPKIATRNLPADMIDKVQVIDKKSDQAEFTKIDDGQREKVINLQVKEEKKHGYFGNASLGGGADTFSRSGQARFDGNLNLNRFEGKQQLSLILNGNNTNKSSFSLQDLTDLSGTTMLGGTFDGGGGNTVRRVMVSSDVGGNPFGPGSGGITTSGMGGFNFRDSWGKKIDINGSYSVNTSTSESQTENRRTNLLSTGNSYYNSQAAVDNRRHNHRLGLNIDYNIDKSNSLRLTPSLSYNVNRQAQQTSFTTLDSLLNRINDGSRKNSTALKAPAFVGNALYRHTFGKRGRTFSINLASSINGSATDAFNNTETNYYALPLPADHVDQHLEQETFVNNQTLKASYTEPLSRERFLEVNYSYTNNYSRADRQTYDFSQLTNEFTSLNPQLSNLYNNTFSANQAGFNIRTVKKKINYTLGLSVQQTHLEGEASNLPAAIDRNFISWLPNANMNVQFSQNRRLFMNYRTMVRQPTIAQLQPVPDNSNPLNVRNGNPDLKPEYNNNLSLNFSSFDMASYRSFFAFLMIQQTNNRIATKIDLDELTGRRSSTPVNVNGNWSATGNLSFGIPVKKLKTSINLNSGLNARRDLNFSNNILNVTNTYSMTQGISWSYNYKELFDFYANASVNYNRTSYSLATLSDLNYYNYTTIFNCNYNLPLGLRTGFDVSYTANTGRGTGYNQNIALVGANVQKELLSKKQATIKLQVFDLFNDNLNVNRNVSENSIEDVRGNNLKRFFMLSFSYKLNKLGSVRPGPEMVSPGGGPVIIMRQ